MVGEKMDNYLELTCDTIRKESLSLHPDRAKMLGVFHQAVRRIKFGTESLVVRILTSDDLPLNEASLSSDIIKKLNIPVNCHFEIQQKNDEIQIGPFIGLLAGYFQESVKRKLDDLLDYLYYYRNIKGAILVFSLDKVDKDNLTVKGYLFNPLTKRWEEGTYPYPTSIIVLTGTASTKWIKHFQSVIGNTVFNDFHFNQWSMYKRLAASIEVKNFLPHTILYRTPQDLYSILLKYPNVYVKSISKNKKSTVFAISKERDNLIITYPKKGKTRRINFYERNQAYSLFKKYFNSGEFIIQESIHSNQIRSIDCKVMIIKNQQGQWQVMGMFARVEKPGSTTGNKKISLLVKMTKETLKETLQVSDLIASILIQEIFHIAGDAVKAIENTGVHFANSVLEMAIDENGRIRIFDIEHCKPNHENALVAGYPELYYEILKTNLLYSKNLGGFI